MKRVVITGMGVVSCLGNDLDTVSHALQVGKSGISFNEHYQERGLRSHVSGLSDLDVEQHIDRKLLRFMGESAAYGYVAMQQAITDACLTDAVISHEDTGLVAASGGTSSRNIVEAHEIACAKSIKRIGPYRVPRTMGSTVSACLATCFKIKGLNYSITSACSTSTHCIGHAMEQIQFGKQKVMFAGGGDGEYWLQTALFDAMGALSSRYNDTPECASRPYDKGRDGFVIASGAGMLVLEELEHAQARGAKIYAELIGYAANSDGHDMVSPSGEGAERCMRKAIMGVSDPIDYINTHGTSTLVGDCSELNAIRAVFQDHVPLISSTKSLSGHSLGATGVHEVIFSLLMLRDQFVAASANIEMLDDNAEGLPIVIETLHNKKINCVLSNNFGFGGTNACWCLSNFKHNFALIFMHHAK